MRIARCRVRHDDLLVSPLAIRLILAHLRESLLRSYP
jgi:hypothetical protein